MLEIGTRLRDRYTVRERVGAGGMGEVYRATDAQLGDEEVAVKRLLISTPDQEQRAAIVEQFSREARILRALKHDHIPRVYDCFEERGDLFLVMDFVEGTTLAALVKANRPPIERVIEWSRQIASALHYLHTHQPHPVIYRDLKPDNLMVTREGHIMLLDFGLAKGARAEQAGTVLKGAGTLAYASPEQIDEGGRSTDARSDLYSLGATLYAMLTGRLPTSSLLRAHALARGGADPLSLNEIPPPLRRLLLSLMALDPEARPSSADTVVREIDALPPLVALPLLRSGPTLAANGRSFRVAAEEAVAPTPEEAGAPVEPQRPTHELPALSTDELEAAYAMTVVPAVPSADGGDSGGLRGFRGAAPKRLDDAVEASPEEPEKKKGWLW